MKLLNIDIILFHQEAFKDMEFDQFFFFSVSGVGLSRMIRALGPASNGTPEGRYIALRRKAK